MTYGEISNHNRITIGTPTLGLVRIEWVRGRYHQAMPVNWSPAEIMPLGFLVDEAQNLIVREFLASGSEWLFLLEDDVILPPNAFHLLNEHVKNECYPVVSGLYYRRSEYPEPLVFRGRGTGAFTDFEPGDMVWADGVPTGCLLIHASVLQAMWDDAPEVEFRGQKTRQIFKTVREDGLRQSSDLKWCDDVIAGDYLNDWDLPHPEWPFLVDTRLFCRHIAKTGKVYPDVR